MEESPRAFSCVRKPLEALPCPPPSSSPQQQFLREGACVYAREGGVCVTMCVESSLAMEALNLIPFFFFLKQASKQ